MKNAEKKKKMKEIGIGVEIEVEAIGAYDAQAILNATGLAAAGWKQVSDGSVPTGREFVSPVLSYDRLAEIEMLVEAVKEKGGQARWNCGVHVHVDSSEFDTKALVRLVKNIHKQEALMYAAFGTLANRLRWCASVSEKVYEKLERQVPKTFSEFREVWGILYSNRFRGLNLQSVWAGKGIEYRYFNASLNGEKIRAYINFCLALTAKALTDKAASGRKARVTNRRGSKEQFRIVLIKLGLIGDEFKATRKVLMSRETLKNYRN